MSRFQTLITLANLNGHVICNTLNIQNLVLISDVITCSPWWFLFTKPSFILHSIFVQSIQGWSNSWHFYQCDESLYQESHILLSIYETIYQNGCLLCLNKSNLCQTYCYGWVTVSVLLFVMRLIITVTNVCRLFFLKDTVYIFLIINLDIGIYSFCEKSGQILF